MLDKKIPDCTIYPLDTATPVSVIGKIIECIKSYRGWTMEIEHIANLATIIGAASILATLGFVVLEIRVNLAQFLICKRNKFTRCSNTIFPLLEQARERRTDNQSSQEL